MLFFHFHQSKDGSIKTASTALPVPLMSAANFVLMYSSAGHKETTRLIEMRPGRQQHFPFSEFTFSSKKLNFKDPKITSTGRVDLLRDLITAVVHANAGRYWITNEMIIL